MATFSVYEYNLRFVWW